MTALTLYGIETASSLATACKLVTSTGGVSASLTTKIGTVQGSGELFSLGSSATFPGTAVSATAGVHGFLWDVSTLAGNRIAAGTWTVKFNLNFNSTYTTMSSTITARVWKRSSGGVYTKIGSDMTVAGPGASTTAQTLFTLTGTSFPSMDFATGDQLYLDVWLTVTSTGGATTRTIALWASSSTTLGIAGQVEIDTPGYAPIPVTLSVTIAGAGILSGPSSTNVLYGSSIADSTLTTACDMGITTGGSETSNTTVSTAANTYVEVWSQGTAGVATVTSIPSTPTGQGWVYLPGAGKFTTGNWSATLNAAVVAGSGSSVSDFTIRFFLYSGGSYTFIGSIISANIPITSANTKTSVAFAATSLSTVTFGATDLLYIDLWWHDASSNAGGDNPSIYVSTSATQGVANDMQVTPPSFILAPTLSATSGGVSLSVTIAGSGVFTPAIPTFSTALTTSLAGQGTLTTSLIANLALPVTTIAGAGVFTPSAPTFKTALSTSIVGVGTFTPTLSAKLALASVTLPGVGTLSGTASVTTALSQTLSGVGLLTPTVSLATSLSTTIPGVGTLTGTLSTGATVALSATIAGTSTLSGTSQLSTALTSMIVGVGTLTGTAQLSTALTSTPSGLGTLTLSAWTLSTALTSTMPGAGTLTATLSISNTVSLSTTIAGVGTFTASTPTFKTALSATIAGQGTLTPGMISKLALPSTTIIGAGTLAGTLAAGVPLVVSLSGTSTLSGTWTVRTALFVTCAAFGTLSGVVSLFNSLAQPGIAILVDSLYGSAGISDQLVSQSGISDVSPGEVTLSDQG